MPEEISQAAESAIASRERVVRALARDALGSHELLCAVVDPLGTSGVLIGASVLVVPTAVMATPGGLDALPASLARFETLLTSRRPPRAAPATPPGASDAERVLALAQLAFAHHDVASAATALLSSLCSTLQSSRGALALKNGQATQLVATSDGPVTAADRLQQGTWLALAATMDEAIDDAQSLRFPLAEGEAPRIVAAHAHLARLRGVQAVLTVPIVGGGEVIGALSFEKLRDNFDEAQLQLVESVSRQIGPWMWAQRRACEPWTAVLRRQLSTRWGSAVREDRARYRLAAVAAAALVGLAVFVPMRHDISANARLEGTTQRVVSAPGDGFLKQVYARPGDVVRAGQPLVDFEGEDLQMDRRRIVAGLSGQEAAFGDALSRHDRAQLAVSGAKVAEFQAQLQLLDERISRAQVTAPFDGVIIQGDLSQALGAPVKKGDFLVTLAPLEGFRAIVEVSDSDVADVKTGQLGSLVLTSRPDQALALVVTRITPLAVQVDGRNVFEVEVAVLEAERLASGLRPGMRGIARLSATRRPLIASVGRDAVAWLRLTTWRWFG